MTMVEMKQIRLEDKDVLPVEPLLPKEEPHATDSRPYLQYLAVTAASLGWMIVSSTLILLNKDLMVVDGFKYPMTLSGMGMGFSAVASFMACRLFRIVPMKAGTTVTANYYVQRIVPVGFFMAVTLHFGNLVYMHLTVSFIQMLKAFTPVITMVFLFIARLEQPNGRMIQAVLIVAFGTAMASYGEMKFSAFGVTVTMLSGAAEALRLVLTQYVLVGLSFNPIEGLMYFAPACVFWLAIGAYFYEYDSMRANNALDLIINSPVKYSLAAGLGFAVNALSYSVIILSSSLTLKLLGTIRSVALVSVCVAFLGEKVTLVEGVGYLASLAGFLWYNNIKMGQIKNQAQLAPEPPEETESQAEKGVAK